MFIKKIYNKVCVFGKWISNWNTSILIILVTSVFATSIFYKLFFKFSSTIWSKNLNVDVNLLSPQVRAWVAAPGQRDGVEAYVLYALVFACIVLTVFLVWLYEYFKRNDKKTLTFFFLAILIISDSFYFFKLGFYPPMSNRASGLASFFIVAIIMLFLWLLLKIAKQKEKLANILISIALLPICFIATSPISLIDYSYIFAPALRLLKHFEIRDIYFQYDLLLSFIAAIWMKLNINLNFFQIIGQFSFYILFLVSFFFSKRFFIKKHLAYYLLVALVLVKIYALMHEPILVFQITPLRLDWWLLILILSFIGGMYNKLLGVALGVLVVFHRTFGLIYVIGYFEIIFVLFLLDSVGGKISLELLKLKIKKHFFLCLPNIIILIFSFIASCIILGGNSMVAASDYQKIGIGFMPISAVSFYWYFPILASATAVLLIKNRRKLSISYFNSGLFLIALAVGNFIYFFGRSHENNIINISASLIFVLFLFLDLVFYPWTVNGDRQSKWIKSISVLIPTSLILLIVFFYSAGIIDRSQIQFKNLLKHQAVYPMLLNLDIQKVRELANNSDKVYFTGNYDFYFYYYGNYTPQGRYSPYLSWVYKKDMVDFIQNLLDKGYYIISPRQVVTEDSNPDDEILAELRYDKSILQDGFRVVWNGK